jgi:Domain of Unknown Function (DUF1080)
MCPRTLILILVTLTGIPLGFAIGADVPLQPKRSVLIVDGVNNHEWERATRILKSILMNSGRFTVPEDFPTASQIKLRSGDEPAASRPPEGFKAVFNGRDLTGWEGSPAYWSVEDGCLTGKADGTLKYNRFIVWRGGTVKNFELRVKVKVSPGGNSGLQYRGTERPDLGESVVTGYQCDVVANRPDYNGMLYEERGRRILAHTGEKVIIDTQGQPWSIGQFPLKEFKPGEWHDYRVLVEGDHYRHWIDGQMTVDVIDLDEKGRKLEGVLAVQVHVGPPMAIQYKDFFLRALPDNLPLIGSDQAPVPPDAKKVAPQGQDKPRKPDST